MSITPEASTRISNIIEDTLVEAYKAGQFTADEAITFLAENSCKHDTEQATRIVESWRYA